ncbi:hypothetical protein SAMN05421595_1030 [Austwickia chelonae]|uniref:VOC domain-containing protein n=1 Tax=Austwickia chelonae NBRC 105200 TaxID=1184607 RepID=K6VPB8_9MICO|nr:VOC family protein [Austwickia chelonae]GAB77215.1 hypothetical protein AUCHE_05_01200 [Austwickia chelonae NBRC 105200]SEW05334.1 hypothetical protein SAMN05421595_1030 [Austwickia chelonae]
MVAVGRLAQLVLECGDAPRLAAFWKEVLDTEEPYGEFMWLTVDWAPVGRLSFHQVDGYVPPEWPGRTGEIQSHFDLLVDNLVEATDRILTAGATALTEVLDPGPKAWRVFADPAGHPFCLVTVPE